MRIAADRQLSTMRSIIDAADFTFAFDGDADVDTHTPGWVHVSNGRNASPASRL